MFVATQAIRRAAVSSASRRANFSVLASATRATSVQATGSAHAASCGCVSCGPSSASATHVCSSSCPCKPAGARRGFFGTSATFDTSTPAGVLKVLEEGNARFIAGNVQAPNRDMGHVKGLKDGQNPFAAVLSCADSRVPVEILFDQGFGDIFVCRIAGNVVNTETIGSLEFGTAVLGAKVLYVLGHSSCGAVNATMAGAAVPGVISSLYYKIKPGCDHSDGTLDSAIEENVKFQVSQLSVSPVLKDLVAKGDLEIVGGVYDLATGKVTRV